MAKTFSKTERGILNLCTPGKIFDFEGSKYKIIRSGKPMPSLGGECKTDVYIQVENLFDNSIREFKISIKQTNADFLENKITKDRALQIFGPQFSEIIIISIEKLREYFESEDLIFFESKGKTEAKSIKMGWRFELFLSKQGNKSERMSLNNEQKIDVFAGTNLSKDKKDSIVTGEVIPNSGVANFVLVVDETSEISTNLGEYLEQLIPIELFAKENEIFFGCKALNYRAGKKKGKKWEGDRSLSVYVEWNLSSENKLSGGLTFSKPLEITGNQIGEKLNQILNQIGIKSENFDDLKGFIINED
jgi:hypothetical protein